MKNKQAHSLAAQYSVFALLFVSLILSGCTCEKNNEAQVVKNVSREVPQWLKLGSLARIELERPAKGKLFSQVEKKIVDLQRAGFTGVWFSTVVPTSSLYRQGVPTDPVPTQDFLNVSKEFGTLDDFKRLVQSLHNAGLKVIIDLAPKYTAWDSKIVQEHPDWYRTNDEGAIVAPNNEWSDVADLNYGHHELRKYMIGALTFWVQDVGVDGFAFQKADLIPLDFWLRARKEVEAVREIVFLGQSNVPEHHLEAFDATYANDGSIPGLLRGEVPTGLSQMLEGETATFPEGSVRVRFNAIAQDYPQEDTAAVIRNPLQRVSTTLAYTMPGVPVTVLDTRWINSKSIAQYDFLEFVAKAMQIRKDFPKVVDPGFTERKMAEEATFLAFERKSENTRLLVLLNYASTAQNVLLQLPNTFRGGFGDYFSGTLMAPKDNTLEITVEPFDVKVLTRTTEGSQE